MNRPDNQLQIDVCMPTWNSGEVLEETLDRLAVSISFPDVAINRLIVVDNLSEDETVAIARSKAREYGWEVVINQEKSLLPKARELAIQMVRAPWFLFLDDDVRLSEEYLSQLVGCIAPSIGAVQGRKLSSTEKPWEWAQRRVYRGGTHATLIRTDALRGISIPQGVKVLEDEYIRRYIESSEYLWIFNHQARFDHDSMERHPMGWEQGYIAGRYELMPFHSIILLIGDAIVSMRNPSDRLVLLFGYLYGSMFRSD